MIKAYCNICDTHHTLPTSNSQNEAKRLIKKIMDRKTVDIFSGSLKSHKEFSTTHLFGEGRGKMFGILEATCKTGEKKFLYAFSGQYNSHWMIPGWVPPPFSIEQFDNINKEREKQIKAVGKEMESVEKASDRWFDLRAKRRKMSQTLNIELQQLCQLQNFRGERKSLPAIFNKRGIPTGTGECCTPKLLNFAAVNGLQPTGLCEFFIGRETKSGSCRHGEFYLPCESKCVPLLGFMLCGLDEK